MRGPGKGNTNNPKGKPKGIKSHKTEEWERFRDVVMGELTADVIKIVGKMTDDQKVDFYVTILKYFKPVQTSTNLTLEKEQITAIEFTVKK